MGGYFLILSVGLIFTACQKENSDPLEFQYQLSSRIDYSAITTRDKGFKGTNGSEQILVFRDMEVFKATFFDLERQTNELDNAFVNFYRDLNEQEINEKEEEIGFDEEVPLLDFEQQLNYHSLYGKIVNEENQWLNQENLDILIGAGKVSYNSVLTW